MPQNLTVLNAAKILTLSATGTAASVAGIGTQMGQTHTFLYLQLPLWFFYIAMVVLAFAFALLSLTTDYMRSRGTMAGKFFTAFAVGLFMSFVVLPAIITEPSPALMMITASVGSLSGTMLLYIVVRLLSNKELHDAVADLIANRFLKFLTVIADLLIDRATRFIRLFIGGDK